jgi:hypothetical protein
VDRDNNDFVIATLYWGLTEFTVRVRTARWTGTMRILLLLLSIGD